MGHVSLSGLGGVVLVRMMVGVCCRRPWRISLGRYVDMSVSGFGVVHAACLLASRSKPQDAGELMGRVMRYL